MPMTPQEKKLRTARTRHLAAVKRSLGLIAEEAAAATATLENGGVPGGGVFQASVTRYENALAVLAALDGITGGDPGPEAGIAEVSRDDLAVLVDAISQPDVLQVLGMPAEILPGSALDRLRQVAFPPFVPDGEPS